MRELGAGATLLSNHVFVCVSPRQQALENCVKKKNRFVGDLQKQNPKTTFFFFRFTLKKKKTNSHNKKNPKSERTNATHTQLQNNWFFFLQSCIPQVSFDFNVVKNILIFFSLSLSLSVSISLSFMTPPFVLTFLLV